MAVAVSVTIMLMDACWAKMNSLYLNLHKVICLIGTKKLCLWHKGQTMSFVFFFVPFSFVYQGHNSPY